MKFLKEKNRWLILIFLIILGSLLSHKSLTVKNTISTVYKKKMNDAKNKLSKKEKDIIQEKLTRLERGKFVKEKEHNTGDFIHLDYFGEPWRLWESTYIVWHQATGYFIIFFLLLSIKEIYSYYHNRQGGN